mmetsp:Transcript_63635/g.170463  ORF Transcript_63635/g.170463 Transcript_63635/m.170463 type:complete len:631 (+) Transcript_63635:43-1935(+)
MASPGDLTIAVALVAVLLFVAVQLRGWYSKRKYTAQETLATEDEVNKALRDDSGKVSTNRYWLTDDFLDACYHGPSSWGFSTGNNPNVVVQENGGLSFEGPEGMPNLVVCGKPLPYQRHALFECKVTWRANVSVTYCVGVGPWPAIGGERMPGEMPHSYAIHSDGFLARGPGTGPGRTVQSSRQGALTGKCTVGIFVDREDGDIWFIQDGLVTAMPFHVPHWDVSDPEEFGRTPAYFLWFGVKGACTLETNFGTSAFDFPVFPAGNMRELAIRGDPFEHLEGSDARLPLLRWGGSRVNLHSLKRWIKAYREFETQQEAKEANASPVSVGKKKERRGGVVIGTVDQMADKASPKKFAQEDDGYDDDDETTESETQDEVEVAAQEAHRRLVLMMHSEQKGRDLSLPALAADDKFGFGVVVEGGDPVEDRIKTLKSYFARRQRVGGFDVGKLKPPRRERAFDERPLRCRFFADGGACDCRHFQDPSWESNSTACRRCGHSRLYHHPRRPRKAKEKDLDPFTALQPKGLPNSWRTFRSPDGKVTQYNVTTMELRNVPKPPPKREDFPASPDTLPPTMPPRPLGHPGRGPSRSASRSLTAQGTPPAPPAPAGDPASPGTGPPTMLTGSTVPLVGD